jgi:hypothetical protein
MKPFGLSGETNVAEMARNGLSDETVATDFGG